MSRRPPHDPDWPGASVPCECCTGQARVRAVEAKSPRDVALAAVERAKTRILRIVSVEHMADPRDWLPASIRADRELMKRIASAAASLPDLRLWRALPPESQTIIVAALQFESVDITDLEHADDPS